MLKLSFNPFYFGYRDNLAVPAVPDMTEFSYPALARTKSLTFIFCLNKHTSIFEPKIYMTSSR